MSGVNDLGIFLLGEVPQLIKQDQGGLKRQWAFGLVQQVETGSSKPPFNRLQVGLAVADLPR
jgi:hypothetical protein